METRQLLNLDKIVQRLKYVFFRVNKSDNDFENEDRLLTIITLGADHAGRVCLAGRQPHSLA